MRDKEASDAERKNVTRTFEKQSQALEKLLETEKVLTSRVVCVVLKKRRMFSHLSVEGSREGS